MLADKAGSRVSSLPSGASSSLGAEIVRLVWWSGATLLALALLSYSPTDPSWTTWTSSSSSWAHHAYRNWMGRGGSIVADLLLQALGLAAFAAAVLVGVAGFRVARAESGDARSWRVTLPLALAFLVTLSGLLQSAIPRDWMPYHLQNPGGAVGHLLRQLLAFALAELGALLVTTLLFLVATMLLFRWKLVTWTLRAILRAARAASAVFRGGGLALPLPRLRLRSGAPAAEVLPVPIQAPVPIATPKAAGLSAKLVSAPDIDEEDESDDDSTPVPLGTSITDDEELFKILAPRAAKKPVPVEPKNLREKRDLHDYQLPNLEILSGRAESKMKTVDRAWYLDKANILVQKLRDFGVEGEVVNICPGPVITVYEFKPASGVKIKEIANLSDDLTLALSVLSVRIVAPIPGKPVVGIEIPSPHRETVFFKDLVQETPFFDPEMRIPVALGRLASGEPVVAGLASMPHLLVAGSTGTGKSVFINTLISSMLYRYSPRELKLILVDPKMVELATYEGIPHLMLPVVVDSKKAALALRWTVDEMERRYSLMHQFGVRHVGAYNDKLAELEKQKQVPEGDHGFLPFIVVVIDEYADLMAVVPKDVELSIARLAQKARASGIHLVLATQRPSTDVVTGTIKANFPSRISFRVASSVDSKTILDRTGAERLLGSGDMLFHSAGFTSLKRMQGAFLSDAELEKIVTHLKSQGEPEYDERLLQYQEEGAEDGDLSSEGGDESGDLYDRAVRLVTEKGEASISLIQRHLKIGYNRAATLMEQMEKDGVVAQATGASKRRAVLVGAH